MKIKYYLEYEANLKPQKPENGTIEINEKEYKIIETACNCRGIDIKTFFERYVSELTTEEVETKFIQWNKKGLI